MKRLRGGKTIFGFPLMDIAVMLGQLGGRITWAVRDLRHYSTPLARGRAATRRAARTAALRAAIRLLQDALKREEKPHRYMIIGTSATLYRITAVGGNTSLTIEPVYARGARSRLSGYRRNGL